MNNFNLYLSSMLKTIKIEALTNTKKKFDCELVSMIISIEKVMKNKSLNNKMQKIILKEVNGREKNSRLLLKFDQFRESDNELKKALSFIIKIYKNT